MFHSETQNENEASISRTQMSAFAPRSFQCKQTMLLMMPTLKAEEEIWTPGIEGARRAPRAPQQPLLLLLLLLHSLDLHRGAGRKEGRSSPQ